MNAALHDAIMWVHIAGGIVAVLTGFLSAGARKGGPLHRLAGTWFFGSMLVLGITASILEPLRTPEPGSPVGGLIICYFVATSWMAARRRDGRPCWFEKAACAAVMMLAVLAILAGLNASTPQPGGAFAIGAICLLAGLLDLNFILRGQLSGGQRIARHLWRMCFAFFIATGSFFLGQQDILPNAVRGSPILFALAFAPFAIMVFWLVRLRFTKMVGRLRLRAAPVPAASAPS